MPRLNTFCKGVVGPEKICCWTAALVHLGINDQSGLIVANSKPEVEGLESGLNLIMQRPHMLVAEVQVHGDGPSVLVLFAHYVPDCL